MKVKITATFTWNEEVTDDDLNDICEDRMVPDDRGDFDDDQIDEAFGIWKDFKEEAIGNDVNNISDDARLVTEIVVVP